MLFQDYYVAQDIIYILVINIKLLFIKVVITKMVEQVM